MTPATSSGHWTAVWCVSGVGTRKTLTLLCCKHTGVQHLGRKFEVFSSFVFFCIFVKNGEYVFLCTGGMPLRPLNKA